MDEASYTCRHTDIRTFASFRCCLSCGKVLTLAATPAGPEASRPCYYEYAPLDYETGHLIRLVNVYPGLKQDDIECELFNANLAASPVYEAVSYTWATTDGDASPSQTISCCGKRLSITKNCEAAIRCLRRRDHTRTLWIDAICIDQKSITERNHQVRFMADIYHNASQVLAYLSFKDHMAESNTTRFIGCLQRGVEDYHGLTHVKKFLEHPYFNRVWIIQEISLAKLVVLHTEDHIVYWTGSTVQMLMSLCRQIKYIPPGVIRWVPATQLGEHSFLDLLQRARHCFATDPRDKVFALFGLLHPKVQESLPADYTMCTEQVFMHVASYLIETMRQLDILKHVLPDQMLDLDMTPSWAPNWSNRDHRSGTPPPFTLSQRMGFVTQRSRRSPPRRLPDTLTNSTDTKREVYPTDYDNFSSNDSDALLWYRCSSKKCSHHTRLEARTGKSPGPPSLRVHAYRLGVVITSFHIEEETEMETEMETLLLALLPPSGSSDGLSDHTLLYQQEFDFRRKQKLSLELSSLALVTRKYHGDKEVFTTEQSVGCMLDASTDGALLLKQGDTIWGVNGLDVPIILRQIDQHYVVVTQCYLHMVELDHARSLSSGNEPWLMEPAIIEIW